MHPIFDRHNVNVQEFDIVFAPDTDTLVSAAVASGEGVLSKDKTLMIKSGEKTGRSAQSKYIVEDDVNKNHIWWENSLGKMSKENFSKLRESALDHLKGKKVFASLRSVGAAKEHAIDVLTLTPLPQHALFANYLFREKQDVEDSFLIIHAPDLDINPSDYGVTNKTVITTCFETNTTIIIGTRYAGEIKKSMFCVLNYRLPESNVLPMHAGASCDKNENVSVFFGLSGTGKTTLSTDEGMFLIGDDEHGLSDKGVFNFEGGCYAKTYKLREESEPEIWKATNRYGAIVENVVFDNETKTINFDDSSITENGRSSYPLEFIDETWPNSKAGVPKNIFFLTADAFGVLPPLSKLTREQAMDYFMLGYTAKLAGTEMGVTSPQTTFSACFGAPFMLRRPQEYAKLLGEYLDRHQFNVWLVNTGWTKGPYGEGERFPIKVTRSLIRAVQGGKLDGAEFEKDPVFDLNIPTSVPNVESDFLSPIKTWSDSDAYMASAKGLKEKFDLEWKKIKSSCN